MKVEYHKSKPNVEELEDKRRWQKSSKWCKSGRTRRQKSKKLKQSRRRSWIEKLKTKSPGKLRTMLETKIFKKGKSMINWIRSRKPKSIIKREDISLKSKKSRRKLKIVEDPKRNKQYYWASAVQPTRDHHIQATLQRPSNTELTITRLDGAHPTGGLSPRKSDGRGETDTFIQNRQTFLTPSRHNITVHVLNVYDVKVTRGVAAGFGHHGMAPPGCNNIAAILLMPWATLLPILIILRLFVLELWAGRVRHTM